MFSAGCGFPDTGDFGKGLEAGEGEYVLVEPDELDEIAPGRSQSIDISDFVDLEAIEPVFFGRTYHVAPRGKEYTKVYELLRAALAEGNKAGIATFVMRNKQYLTALRAENKVLVLQSLHWADEVHDPASELTELPSGRAGSGKELDMALQLVNATTSDWDCKRHHDTHEEKVRKLVKAKAAGQEIMAAEAPPKATDVVDLKDQVRTAQHPPGCCSEEDGETTGGEGPAEEGRGGIGALSGPHHRRQARAADAEQGGAVPAGERPGSRRPVQDEPRGAHRRSLLLRRARDDHTAGRHPQRCA
ncbi:Ku protein [Streptomyces collinus]|uniref:non-homologous end joining protein Ku n=1 Tax=Streptomyces collinus TaxID=42684 RepID=UPI00333454B8